MTDFLMFLGTMTLALMSGGFILAIAWVFMALCATTSNIKETERKLTTINDEIVRTNTQIGYGNVRLKNAEAQIYNLKLRIEQLEGKK